MFYIDYNPLSRVDGNTFYVYLPVSHVLIPVVVIILHVHRVVHMNAISQTYSKISIYLSENLREILGRFSENIEGIIGKILRNF